MDGYGIDMPRSRGAAVTFDDRTTALLKAFDADKGVVARVVGATALRLKEHAREANAATFPRHTGAYQKSIWYKQGRNSQRATLYAGNLSSVYEHRGAWIQPMDAKALRFTVDGRTVFYRGVIRVEPRPWFNAAMRDAEARGLDDAAAVRQLERELREAGLG